MVTHLEMLDPRISNEGFRYSSTSDCQFYTLTMERRLAKIDVKARPSLKEKDVSRPICCCSQLMGPCQDHVEEDKRKRREDFSRKAADNCKAAHLTPSRLGCEAIEDLGSGASIKEAKKLNKDEPAITSPII